MKPFRVSIEALLQPALGGHLGVALKLLLRALIVAVFARAGRFSLKRYDAGWYDMNNPKRYEAGWYFPSVRVQG